MSNTADTFIGTDQRGQDETTDLLIDGGYGIFVPQAFAKGFDLSEWGVSKRDREILEAGPEHPEYWEAWDDVLGYALYTNAEGTWRLEQDGDLWAVKLEDISDA